MKFSTLVLLLGSIASTSAYAENIIRINAPITAARVNVDDYWVASDSQYTDWTQYSSSCKVTPENSALGLGAFTQNKVCSIGMQRYRQGQEYNTFSKEFRDVGTAVAEYKLTNESPVFYRSGECRFSMEMGKLHSNWQMRIKDGVDYTNAVSWAGTIYGGVWSPSTEMTILGKTYFKGVLGERDDPNNSVYYATCKVND